MSFHRGLENGSCSCRPVYLRRGARPSQGKKKKDDFSVGTDHRRRRCLEELKQFPAKGGKGIHQNTTVKGKSSLGIARRVLWRRSSQQKQCSSGIIYRNTKTEELNKRGVENLQGNVNSRKRTSTEERKTN